jgi:hypothetical protein
MNTTPRQTVQWFVLGLLCHLLLLLTLVFGMRSVPDSWRGPVLVEGQPGGAPWGAGGPAVREVRDYDATLLGLVALSSVVVSLVVMWLSWNRRRCFAVGFLVPALWGIFYLLK